MKFCTHCLYPETKPDLTFDESGKCSACQAFDTRLEIDWDKRALDFKSVVISTKVEAAYRGAPYECIIPVSGGKDSHHQVLTALQWGLKVLAVTAGTDHLSDIGRRNLDNIAKLGVDHVEIKTNPVIRRRINRFTLETIGDISWAEHITIFSIPVRAAMMAKIPLIIWGENSQNEYGGPEKAQTSTELTQDWLNEFGGLNGLRVSDIEAAMGPIGDAYHYPQTSGDENKVQGIFLGQFFAWNGSQNALQALQHGFEVHDKEVEGSYGNYENLDNCQTGIHDYFKYIKFGFGRATDILCNMIRRGMISREYAAIIAQERDGAFPWTYLGVPIHEIIGPLGLSGEEFLEVCDTFTNRSLFTGSHVNATIAPRFEIRRDGNG